MKPLVNEKRAVAPKELRPQANIHSRTTSLSPSHSGLKVKSILVPVDFSDACKPTLQYAISLALDYEADISLIHVIEPEAYSLISEIELSESRITFVESATARLAKTAQQQIPDSIKVNTWVQIGAPYEQIVSAARILKADLIVVSTHGYTGFRHAILGSTAERIVRHAHCPVLVLRHAEASQPKGSL